jgi:hypothetical protein
MTSATQPRLEDLRVASPCTVDWDSMQGDAQVRHCQQCDLDVYNLSAMTRAEAEAFVREREGGEVCVRLYQRRDGTVISRDCPVGLAARLRRRLVGLKATLAAGLALLVGGLVGRAEACDEPPRPDESALIQDADTLALAELASSDPSEVKLRAQAQATKPRGFKVLPTAMIKLTLRQQLELLDPEPHGVIMGRMRAE